VTGQDEPEPALRDAVSDGPAVGGWWEENDQSSQPTIMDSPDVDESRTVASEEVETWPVVDGFEKTLSQGVAKPNALSRIRKRVNDAKRLRKMASVWWVNVWTEAEQVSETPLPRDVEKEEMPDSTGGEESAQSDTADPVDSTLSWGRDRDAEIKEQHTNEEASLEDKVHAIELFDPLVSVPEFLAETVGDREESEVVVTPERASKVETLSATQPSETESQKQRPVRSSTFISSGYVSQ
jgi:hypothetical protein